MPDLREVRHASELTDDSFRLRSAGGYPQILDRIRGSVDEVQSAGVRLDEFFVCLDAEEESYDERYARVAGFLQQEDGWLLRRAGAFASPDRAP